MAFLILALNQILNAAFGPHILLLLYHLQVPSNYNGFALKQPLVARSFDDSDPYISTNKLGNGGRGLADNNLLKSFSADKEKANVAKIKVVVCLFAVHLCSVILR